MLGIRYPTVKNSALPFILAHCVRADKFFMHITQVTSKKRRINRACPPFNFASRCLNPFKQAKVFLPRDAGGSQVVFDNKNRHISISRDNNRPDNSITDIDEVVTLDTIQCKSAPLKNTSKFFVVNRSKVWHGN